MRCSKDARLWLDLLSAEGIGAPIWLKLGRRIPLENLAGMVKREKGRRELERLIGRSISGFDSRFAARHLEAVEKGVLGIISITDDAYPPLLKEIQNPPPVLFYRGVITKREKPTICVVGSRNASRRGRITARRLARNLVENGLVVVSGMARGIDTAAHEGALEGGGQTIAVLGCGVDVPYPPENSSLAVEITESGWLVSEFPLGSPPLKHHFPSRNRVLSGISLGVLVVEAGIKSGAMLTAGWAADQGREVCAVPGPVEFSGSRGTHRLIKDGAQLVENAEDILEFLTPFYSAATVKTERNQLGGIDLSGPEKVVLKLLELQPRHVDEIVEDGGMPSETVLNILLALEIKGLCRSCGSGLFAAADLT